MAVEISILSGARQGQRFSLEATRFRAGPDPGCEVFFDPSLDSPARDRSVSLCLMEDGWYIQSTGPGEVFVNQSPVVGLTRIRSGSIVRMSEYGPEFEFSILSRSPSPGEAPGSPPSVPASPYSPVAPAGPVVGLPAGPSLAAPGLPVTPVPVQEPVRPASPAPHAGDSGRLAVIVGGIILGCLVLLVAIKLLSPPQVVIIPPQGSAVEKVQKVEKEEGSPEKKARVEEETHQAPTASAEAAPPAKADPLLDRLKDAVLLIEVEEKTGKLLPFATCCALSADTVLTSAGEALKLSEWRTDPRWGFKAWVTNPATGLKLAAGEIRLYAVSVATSKPDDWIFTNLALISVQGTLPKTVELAGAEELAQLAQGNTVHAFGYTHEGDLIGDADHFAVNHTPARIVAVAVHPDLPGKPRRLGIRAELPKSAYGSPIVNSQGKVVAIYSVPFGEAGGDQNAKTPAMQDMHYATVVNPGVIELGLNKSDPKMWVSTTELKLPASPK